MGPGAAFCHAFLGFFKEKPGKGLSRNTPSVVSHLPFLGNRVGIQFRSWGWNPRVAALICVTLGEGFNLTETVSSSLQWGWAHLLLSVVRGEQMR